MPDAASAQGRPNAIYTRLSRLAGTPDPDDPFDTSEDETVARQEADIREYAAEHNLPIDDLHVYVDNNRSAWRRKAAHRPEFLRMMKVAAAGELAGILIWKLDRFTRAPRDMEDLIELADEHGVVIDGPKSGRIDLTTAQGRQQARGAANQAAAESDNTSERSTRGLYAKAGKGMPMGAGRMFGFDGAEKRQRIVIREDEAQVVREMAKRMLAGEPLQHLAADLNARGLTTTRGNRWTGANLGRVLGQHRYGGKVEMRGRIVGIIPGEPILDADTYEAVQAMVTSRHRGRRPTGRFVLTGLANCGRCHRTMNGATANRTRRRQYRCPPHLGGCAMSVDATHLEAMVDAHMIGLLSDPATVTRIAAKDAALGLARAEALNAVENIERQLVDLEVKRANEEIIQAAYDQSKPVYDRRLAKARAALAEVGSAPALAIDAQADWADATAEEKRILIRRFGVNITVDPPPPGIRRWVPERVRIS